MFTPGSGPGLFDGPGPEIPEYSGRLLRRFHHWRMADLVQNRLARVRDGLDKDIGVAVVDHPVQLAPDHQDRRLDVGDGIAEIRLEAGIADGGKDDFVDFPVGDGLFFHYVENRPGYKRALLQGEIQQLVEVTFLLRNQRVVAFQDKVYQFALVFEDACRVKQHRRL